jgi:signal peptidase I
MGARTGLGRSLKVNTATILLSLGLYTGSLMPERLVWTRVVPSQSMKPTLYDGDYVLGFPKATGIAPAGRGDVVVFSLPADPSTDYIKRVIGLPGERVQLIDGVVHINGQPVKRQPIAKSSDATLGAQNFTRWRETLPNGLSYETVELTKPGFLANTMIYTVPERSYFMLGDNRDNSVDSRLLAKVGYIPADNIVGRAAIVYFSIDHEATSLFSVVRWSRLFTIVR